MAGKLKIMPVVRRGICDKYKCRSQVAWAIGAEDSPKSMWSYYCDKCMRDMLEVIPNELISCLERGISYGEEGEWDSAKEEVSTLPPAKEQETEEEVNTPEEETEEEVQEKETEKEVYACEYCGKEFSTLNARKQHYRFCKEMKKEDGDGEN
jgi:hypothetical protein